MTGIQEADSSGEKGGKRKSQWCSLWMYGEREKPGQSLQLEVPLQVVVETRNLHGSSKINLNWKIIMSKSLHILIIKIGVAVVLQVL
ncbi:hypothetical protein ACFX14_026122 [Malus domestica]